MRIADAALFNTCLVCVRDRSFVAASANVACRWFASGTLYTPDRPDVKADLLP